MPIEKLACPNCHCELTPPAASATGMNCPRCITWLEFDPQCLGTCISCHKMQQANPRHCIEPDGKEEVVALGLPASRQESPKWESVFGRFFSQR
jgi:hypothetical protein